MPSDEFIGWQAYFGVVPFSQEREDRRIAMLISSLTYISSMMAQGKGLKQPIPEKDMIPDYWNTSAPRVRKTLKQQREEFLAFKASLHPQG